MNELEKFNELIDKIPTWHSRAKDGVANLLRYRGLSEEDPNVSSLLSEFAKRIAAHPGDFNFLEAEFKTLDQRMGGYVNRRPSEADMITARQSIASRAAACGWISEEIHGLLLRVDGNPSRISEITWRAARLDGKEISRTEVRQGLRTAAYSDSGWANHLAELPQIAEPSQEPR